MCAVQAGAGLRHLVLGVLAFTTLGHLSLAAAPPERMPRADELSGVRQEPTPAPLKTYTFEMRSKPWAQVIEWLSDITGMPFIGPYLPTGTFNFIGSAKKGYTVPEIIDIINEALLSNKDTQKYILVRRERSFTLLPADEPIDALLMQTIKLEDLAGRGNTELVSVVLPLRSLVAEDVVSSIQKMLGPFGSVTVLEGTNRLVLLDTAGNLKRIHETIREIESSPEGKAETFSHPCKYVKARDAEKLLRSLLGDPLAIARTFAQQQGQGRGNQGGGPPQPAQALIVPRLRMHYISADETTNTVFVTGPADKIAQARELLRRLDEQQGGRPRVLIGPPFLKTYNLTTGGAEALARTLQEVYKDVGSIRITAAGSGKLLVWAMPGDQLDIAKHIHSEEGNKAQLIALNTLDAADLARTLQGMFGDSKGGAPFIEAETLRNAIIVRGTREQVEEVKSTINALGDGAGSIGGDTRIISLNSGSAATLAEALERVLNQMGKYPVKVIRPPGSEQKPEPVGKPAAQVPEPRKS
jgi:type II secretory pathway component GspD/PulD (secretin)